MALVYRASINKGKVLTVALTAFQVIGTTQALRGLNFR